MALKRNAAALGVGAAAVALYVLSRDDEKKDALLDAFEDIREGVAGAIVRVRAAADAIVERVTAPESDPPAPPPAAAASPLQRLFKEVAPMASPLADHEAFDEEEAPEDQDEDDALADAADAIATHPAAVPSFVPSGDTTPLTTNPSPTVSPFKVTYPIGGTPTKPPPEEEDEARALTPSTPRPTTRTRSGRSPTSPRPTPEHSPTPSTPRLTTRSEARALLDPRSSPPNCSRWRTRPASSRPHRSPNSAATRRCLSSNYAGSSTLFTPIWRGEGSVDRSQQRVAAQDRRLGGKRRTQR